MCQPTANNFIIQWRQGKNAIFVVCHILYDNLLEPV